MITLFKPLLIICISLISGYIFGRIYGRGEANTKKMRVILQRIALLLFNPIAFLGAMWISPIRNVKLIALPFVAVIAIITGGVLTYLYCRIRKLDKYSTGSLIPVGTFINLGSVGGIVLFFFLGEPGFSILPIFKLFEEMVNFGLGFPAARSFSKHAGDREHLIKGIFKDPFIMTMFTAVIIGLILNFSGVPRPIWYGDLNGVLITLATVFLLFSIGMAFHFTSIKQHLHHGVAICVIKTIMVPLIAVGVTHLFNLQYIEDGLILKVVLILTAMPAGFVSLVPATIYDLDIDLSNAAWLSTMASLIYTLPLLAFLLTFL